MKHEIKDVLPVVHMPYEDDQSIDYATLQREIDYLFAIGAHGFSLALVSDLLKLPAAERLDLPAKLVEFAADRGPVVVSVGAESTVQARQFARAAEDGGASAIMAIPPISQAISEEELEAYFEGLLAEVEIPLLIQDASSYVGRSMSLEFQTRMFKRYEDRILFKPEASPLGPCISALRDETGGLAGIFEGSGGVLLVDSYRRGIRGTIPGVELLDGTVALYRALQAGDDRRIYELYFPICGLIALQLQGGLDGFIVIERYLMHRRGLFKNQVHRSPLGYILDAETRAEIDRLFAILQNVLTA
ncbi:MAG: dihydrodipicolinate synthase family protein [Gemmatimonadetes bacterium]|nr:dihydrodipicolinate synthase family protein [Gemmatimonadota bacterium]